MLKNYLGTRKHEEFGVAIGQVDLESLWVEWSGLSKEEKIPASVFLLKTATKNIGVNGLEKLLEIMKRETFRDCIREAGQDVKLRVKLLRIYSKLEEL